MQVGLFLLLSLFEWFSLLLFTFALFRLEIRSYIVQLGFAAFLLALVSYMLFNVFGLTLLATLIQPIIVFFFFWLQFKIPAFYAGLYVVNGYLAYLLVSAVLYVAIDFMEIKTYPGTNVAYILQFIVGMIVLLFIWLIVRFRLGYSFQHSVFEKKNSLHRKLLVLNLIGYAAMASYNLLYYGAHKPILVLIATVFIFALLQYWMLRNEQETTFQRRNRPFRM